MQKVIAGKLRAARAEARLTIRKLATALGQSDSWIARRESGEIAIEAQDLVLWGRACDMPPEWPGEVLAFAAKALG